MSVKFENGYTLTEVLIVLLLLSLITAIGPVAIRKLLPSVAVNSATRVLNADLELLRTRAMLGAREGELRIENDGRNYMLLMGGTVIKRRTLTNSVRIHIGEEEMVPETGNIMIASADGRLSGGPFIVSRAKISKIIEINPIFGTAEIVW